MKKRPPSPRDWRPSDWIIAVVVACIVMLGLSAYIKVFQAIWQWSH